MKRVKHILWFIICCLAAGTLPSQASAIQSIDFELINGYIVLDAKCNGESGTYIFDTGAPGLILNASHAYTGQTKIIALHGVQGEYETEVFPANSFTLGNCKVRNLDAYLLPLDFLEKAIGKPIDGLFGLTVIDKYEILIDMPGSVMKLSKRRGQLNIGNEAVHVPMENQQHLPTVAFSIGEHTYRFGLDTGSKSNLICRQAAKQIPGFRVNVEDHVALSSADQHLRIVPLVAIDIQAARTDVMASSYYLSFLMTDLTTLIADAAVQIDGILGQDFMVDKVILIDKKRESIGITVNDAERNSLALR